MLRRLTFKLFVAAVAISGGYWGARMLTTGRPEMEQQVVATPNSSVPRVEIAPLAASGGSGEALMLKVTETLERRPNIVAKVRQSLRLGDRRLSGEGEFWQQGVGNQRRTRWEIKTLVDGDASFVTQVYDGENLWTDRKLPGTRKMTRVDMEKIRQQIAGVEDGAGKRRVAAASLEILARGGLSQLVATLQRQFEFGPAHAMRQGDRTVQATIGSWRPEQLDRLWPGLAEMAAASWPSQLPHHVLVYVDNDSRFPYLIEYRDQSQAALAGESAGYFPAREPWASYEFIDVQFTTTMPASLFQFAPADVNWHDVTGRVVEQLLQTAPDKEPVTAQRQGTWR